MTPEECLQSGDISGALDSLKIQVRKHPADVKYRIFLFQLLAILGEWDSALTQLNVAGELDSSALAMMHMYRDVITCEVFREQVFKGEKEPIFLGKPETWSALWIQALKLHSSGQYEKAQTLKLEALDAVTDTSGTIDGDSFEWIADADSRLGPVLEVILEGRYLWTPFANIQSIIIEPPEDLRDMIWLPAQFRWQNGGESYGLIPGRYPESYRYDDPQITLSRKTDWDKFEPDTWQGKGQRVFMTENKDYSLFDIRHIEFQKLANAGEEEEGHAEG